MQGVGFQRQGLTASKDGLAGQGSISCVARGPESTYPWQTQPGSSCSSSLDPGLMHSQSDRGICYLCSYESPCLTAWATCPVRCPVQDMAHA